MFARRLRSRMLDVAVTAVCLGCIAAPFVAAAFAEQGALVESSTSVDQKVRQTGWMSQPLNGAFRVDGDGRADGQVEWDNYTTAVDGFKLLVASDRDPAMRDANDRDAAIGDYGSGTPTAWSVGSDERRFGFSATGSAVLSSYGDGTRWRGFIGREAVEVARRTNGPVSSTRTRLKLRAEFGNSLGSNANPTTNITATAVMHL